jgi:hypothetical protein
MFHLKVMDYPPCWRTVLSCQTHFNQRPHPSNITTIDGKRHHSDTLTTAKNYMETISLFFLDTPHVYEVTAFNNG